MKMTLFQAVLMLAAFLCSLVAGLLFAFATVVMPGIRRLGNGDFIRSFQVMDRIIQNNQSLGWKSRSITPPWTRTGWPDASSRIYLLPL